MEAAREAHLSEQELVARACRGDREAYGVLVTRYSSMVTRSLYYRVGDRDEAEDLAQEVFVRAYRGMPGFRQDASFRTWLYRIVHNVSCSHFASREARKRAVSPVSMDRDDCPVPAASERCGPAAHAMACELRGAIDAAIQSLPTDMREYVVLRDIEERSYEEICAIADVPLGTVKSRIHRARLLLREKLKGYL